MTQTDGQHFYSPLHSHMVGDNNIFYHWCEQTEKMLHAYRNPLEEVCHTGHLALDKFIHERHELLLGTKPGKLKVDTIHPFKKVGTFLNG